MIRRTAIALTAAALCAMASVAAHADAPPATAAVVAAPVSAAQQLFADYWEDNLRLNPLQATFVGDGRYNDQLPNFLTTEARAAQHAFAERWLLKVKALDPKALSASDLASAEILERELVEQLEGEQFPAELIPLNQFYGFHSLFAQLGSGTSAQPFATVADYDNWLKRAAQIPAIFTQAQLNMREGIAKGVVQPKVLMERTLPQIQALITEKPEDSLFWGPIKNMPAEFADADKQRLTAAYRDLIAQQLVPAYQGLARFVAEEYLPKCRDTVGIYALPNGKAWYAFMARSNTTTDVPPSRIHAIGKAEVARIQGEIRKVMKQIKFKGDLQAFFKYLNTDKRFEYPSEQALLDHYNGLRKTVDTAATKLFSLTPKAGFEIRPVEAFRAKSAAGGSYQSPSEDGTRPGVFYVNTYDLPSRKSWDAVDLYLHEAVPGHHYQIALQQELANLPKFRRFGGTTAFAEGWGLYAESVGKELGVLNDPYDYVGYLQNELWRAIRLVVDTGIHEYGWTRQQVLDYMRKNSAESDTQSAAEAERYMAIPGQALAYKMGELKIKALRAKAQKALGKRFDIRAFHAEVLQDGAVPLAVLEAKVDRWMATQR